MDNSRSSAGGGSIRIHHLTASTKEGLSRFPKLEDCAHFHYEHVELAPLQVCVFRLSAAEQIVSRLIRFVVRIYLNKRKNWNVKFFISKKVFCSYDWPMGSIWLRLNEDIYLSRHSLLMKYLILYSIRRVVSILIRKSYYRGNSLSAGMAHFKLHYSIDLK